MTDLKTVGETLNSSEVMTSLQIAELTGKRHDNIMRDIRSLLEQGINALNFEEVNYMDNKGEKRPCFNLTKKGCLILASGYDALLREKIINRWEELELQSKPKLPSSYLEALKALISSEEEKQTLLIENNDMKPKAEFYDDIIDSKDAIDMARVAKTLNMGVGRNTLFEILRDNKILMGNNSPYQKYVDASWFKCIESKYTKPNGDTCINIKTVVLQKGVDGIRKLLISLNKK